MRLLSKLPYLSAGLFLAGCVVIQPTNHTNQAAYDFFTYAAGDRDFRLVIVGDPFPGAGAELERITADAFARAHPSLHANFTTRPGPSERKPFRAVIAFNPPPTLLADQLCQSEQVTYPATKSADLQIMMAFCTNRAESEVSASIRPAPSIGSAELKNALVDIAIQLLPDNSQEKRRH